MEQFYRIFDIHWTK